MTREQWSPAQWEIYQFINERGFTSRVCLMAAFDYNRNTIDGTLNLLWLCHRVHRPLKGLVISEEWLQNNPKQRKRIEIRLNIALPKL